MATPSISHSGSASSLTFEDYTLYSNLSDNELLQLAIERSLIDTHGSAATTPAISTNSTDSTTKSTTTQLSHHNKVNPSATNRNQPPAASAQNPRAVQMGANYSSPNPPIEKPPDPKTFVGTVSRFMTGSGKRMVAYYKADGSLVHIGPEPEEEEEPLFRAIREGDSSRVKALAMCPGTNLMLPSKPGWLAVHQAAWFGQESCLQMLLLVQPGMINKRTSHGETPLFAAVSRVYLGCVQLLLENGADPDIPNYEKETPLYKACERSNPAIVAVLLNSGAEVNTHCFQGWTALQEAASRDNMEICEMLLKAGAKHNVRNMYGITPLFTAAQNGQLAALRLLIKHGS